MQWAALPILYDKFDVAEWSISQQIAAQPPDIPLYLTPRDSIPLRMSFALETHQRQGPIMFDGNHIFPLMAQVSPTPELYIVIEPLDARTHLLWPELFPTIVRQPTPIPWLSGSDPIRLYLRPANTTPQHPPQHMLTTTLGDGIALLGYDVQPERLWASHILYLQLHWLVQKVPTGDWTVFTHLLVKDSTGAKHLIAGIDSQPGGGSLLTPQWQKGWRILDEYQIKLPANLKPGEYGLEIGLYQVNGLHLPPGSAGVTLGNVKIE